MAGKKKSSKAQAPLTRGAAKKSARRAAPAASARTAAAGKARSKRPAATASGQRTAGAATVRRAGGTTSRAKASARPPAARKRAPRAAARSSSPSATTGRGTARGKNRLGLRELHVTFNTRRLEAMIAWLQDRLGLPLDFLTGLPYASVDLCPGASLGFMEWSPGTAAGRGGANGTAQPANAGLYLICDDVDKVHGLLSERGVLFEGPPRDQAWGHRTIRTVDPEGRTVVFAQILARP